MDGCTICAHPACEEIELEVYAEARNNEDAVLRHGLARADGEALRLHRGHMTQPERDLLRGLDPGFRHPAAIVAELRRRRRKVTV